MNSPCILCKRKASGCPGECRPYKDYQRGLHNAARKEKHFKVCQICGRRFDEKRSSMTLKDGSLTICDRCESARMMRLRVN